MRRMIAALAMVAGSIMVANPAFAEEPAETESTPSVSQAEEPAPPPEPPPAEEPPPPPPEEPPPPPAEEPPPPPPAVEELPAPPPPGETLETPPEGLTDPTAPVELKATEEALLEIQAVDPNVTLCHATSSESNPFELITVAAAAAFNGHYGHAEDDIPEFTYKGVTYPAQNGAADCGGEEEPPSDGDSESVTLCHATGSESHPFELITISAAGAYNGHYLDHEDDDIPEFTYQGVTYPAQNGSADCESEPPPDDRVSLCHATGSESNPFVFITISAAGAFNGHLGHQDGEDIIPPFIFEGNEYSQNWDEEGMATFFNDCKPDEDEDEDEDDDDGEDPVSASASLPDTGGTPMTLFPLGAMLLVAGSLLVRKGMPEELPVADDLTALDDVTEPLLEDASAGSRLGGIGTKPLLLATIGAAAVVAGVIVVRRHRSG